MVGIESNPQGGVEAEEGSGAAKLFEQTSSIRSAIQTLESEQRETRKRYKKALKTLREGLDNIYFAYEDKQMLLFEEEPSLSPEVAELITHPSLM